MVPIISQRFHSDLLGGIREWNGMRAAAGGDLAWRRRSHLLKLVETLEAGQQLVELVQRHRRRIVNGQRAGAVQSGRVASKRTNCCLDIKFWKFFLH